MGVKKLKKATQTHSSYSIEDSQCTGTETGTNAGGTRIISFDKDDNTAKIQIKEANEIPASLVLLVGPHLFIGHSWTIEEDIVTIGRSSRLANIAILDSSISKTHFQIQKEEDGLYILDLRSTNKTYVNNEMLVPYKKYLLKNNSQIRSGNIVLKFLAQGNLEIFSNRQVFNRSHTDSLTGLSNRAALKIKGPEFFKSDRSFCIISLDIDHFKKINDQYGHLAGDYVLKKVSKKMQELVRLGDIAFRYGGEEFCIFTRSPYNVAIGMAERIRLEIEKKVFKFKNEEIKITLSLGVTSSNGSDKSWQDVYSRADAYLYKAKNSGRNRVVAKDIVFEGAESDGGDEDAESDGGDEDAEGDGGDEDAEGDVLVKKS